MVSLGLAHSSVCYSTDVSPGCVTPSAYCSQFIRRWQCHMEMFMAVALYITLRRKQIKFLKSPPQDLNKFAYALHH